MFFKILTGRTSVQARACSARSFPTPKGHSLIFLREVVSGVYQSLFTCTIMSPLLAEIKATGVEYFTVVGKRIRSNRLCDPEYKKNIYLSEVPIVLVTSNFCKKN